MVSIHDGNQTELRHRSPLRHLRAGLGTPQDLQRIAVTVILDGGEGHQAITVTGDPTQGRHRARRDIGDHPVPTPYSHQLARLGAARRH